MHKMFPAICFALSVCFSSQVLDGAILSDYKNVAITTDLEPDDVLALKIIFQEANDVYYTHPENGYPIQLVLVGEGNGAIKKLRMETLITNFFNVPESVNVEVVAGQSTSDNPFPYDGRELFSQEILDQYPFPTEKEDGTQALVQFVENSEHPLIIQLKPVQELVGLSFATESTQKIDVIFYGSFNFRKSLLDPTVIQYFSFDENQSANDRLQMLLDHLGQRFTKIEIVESYGVLGDQSAVYSKFPWSHPVIAHIEQSSDPFYSMFRTLVSNWNLYLFQEQMLDLKTSINAMKGILLEHQDILAGIEGRLVALRSEWNEETFSALFDQITSLISEFQGNNSIKMQKILDQLSWDLKFANQIKPSSGLQFTLSDVIVALALCDTENFFTSAPVKLTVTERGFITSSPEPESNIFYYDRKDRDDFVKALLQKL